VHKSASNPLLKKKSQLAILIIDYISVPLPCSHKTCIPSTKRAMERAPQYVLFLLLIFSSAAAQNTTGSSANEFHVGVILDLGSLVGKVARTSVSLAVQDFYAACQNCSRKLVLHVRDSAGNDVQAASAGMCFAAALSRTS